MNVEGVFYIPALKQVGSEIHGLASQEEGGSLVVVGGKGGGVER